MKKKVLIEKMYEGMEDEDITIYWRKDEGNPVEKGEPILDAETFKSTFEIISPVTGFLLKQCIKNGEETKINMTIGILSETLEDEVGESDCIS